MCGARSHGKSAFFSNNSVCKFFEWAQSPPTPPPPTSPIPSPALPPARPPSSRGSAT